MRSLKLAVTALAAASLLLSGCGVSQPCHLFSRCVPAPEPLPPDTTSEVHSSKQRITSPNVSSADLAQLSADNADFGFDLYRAIRGKRARSTNLVFSPLSISTAFAMAYAGTAGDTASQMRAALRFTLPDDRLHAAFNATDLALANRGQNQQGIDGQPFRLHSVNASWGQDGFTFLPAYLDTLALNYGAGLRVVDFNGGAESARQAINAWVSNQTESRIPELLQQGSVDSLTRLVLTNAVYFNASWAQPFDVSGTADAPFHKLDGSTVQAPLMHVNAERSVAVGPDFTVAQLPYAGNELDFVLLVPEPGKFDAVESSLTSATLNAALASAQRTSLDLRMPKFKLDRDVAELTEALEALGIKDAFDAAKADFSAMDGARDLSITGVVHKVYMDVNEKGTEAAAATGITVGVTSVPAQQLSLVVDRPFFFAIRDRGTNAIVFFGAITDPL